jgi:hypothetical protein
MCKVVSSPRDNTSAMETKLFVCILLGAIPVIGQTPKIAGSGPVNRGDVRPLVEAQPAASAVRRLWAKTAVEPIANLKRQQIAGRYINPPQELIESSGPPAAGNSLYIFPDGTYVYCQWAAIMPITVFDKGRWSFAAGVVELRSDRIVIWNPDLERRFVVARRTSRVEEILLIGAEKALRRFEEQAGGDPETMLLRVAKQRVRAINPSEVVGMKAALLREGWRPQSLGKQP